VTVLRLALLVALAAAVGAGNAAADPAATCPSYNPPNALTLSGGTPQSAKLDAPFDANLQVALANTNGCPITTPLAGIAITFAAPGSGPSGTFSSSGANAVLVGTNASGSANAPMFTANDLPGGYQVVASSDYGAVSFSLVNTASGVPASIAAVTPSQSTAADGRYAQPLRAKVTDANGAPVEGATVTFSLGSESGSGSGAGAGGTPSAGASFATGSGQATAQTDATGTAVSPPVVANGTAGRFTAQATAGTIAAPATFRLDNLAAKPPTIAALGPAGQSATVGGRFGKPLRVRVRGAGGKPVQGASVVFTLGAAAGGAGGSPTAGASFVGGANQATETTGADGVAVSPRAIANGVAGRFTATATTSGTNAAATFSLDNLAGRGETVRPAGDAETATVGSRYPNRLRVKVLDARGKPAQGVSVTFTLGAGGAGGSGAAAAGASFAGGANQATATTNAAGIASSPRFAANTTAGTFTATASATGANALASFALRNLPAQPHSVAAGVAATESTAVGSRFPIPLAVTVDDAHGNPVAGVRVTFTAPTHGASGRFGSAGPRTVTVRTNANGVAVAPAFVADRIAGGYVVRASVAGHAAAFGLVNL
jgi:hypothetical protein